MNLQKLFEIQAVLDADILKHHPVQPGEDRLSKKILALLVELGECANEWRGFKFWSNDQGGEKHLVKCECCNGKGFIDISPTAGGHGTEFCVFCEGTGLSDLLIEYVDCLHFALSIGNDLKIVQNHGLMKSFVAFNSVEAWSITNHFNYTFRQVKAFAETVDQSKPDKFFFARALLAVLQLGHKLGFTWEQIEQAYYSKNQINFERQATGY